MTELWPCQDWRKKISKFQKKSNVFSQTYMAIAQLILKMLSSIFFANIPIFRVEK